jgi:hypothetical protein
VFRGLSISAVQKDAYKDCYSHNFGRHFDKTLRRMMRQGIEKSEANFSLSLARC